MAPRLRAAAGVDRHSPRSGRESKQAKGPAKKPAAPRKTRRNGGRPQKNRRAPGFEVRARAALIAAVCTALALGSAVLLLLVFGGGKNAAGQSPAAAAPPERTAPAVTVPAQQDRPPAAALPAETGPREAAPPVRQQRPEQAVPAANRLPPAPAAAPPPRAIPPAEKPAVSPPARTAPAGRPERPRPPEIRGTVALVIDDAGNNLQELEPFLAFPGPLTIAVLPGLPYSAEAARRIRAAGKELFLHQPMEALGGQNPGPGAVYSGMDSAEIRRIIGRNIDEIGPVAGINNHQGSRITMDEKAMETILALCRERDIYFLDSRTTADTAAPEAARRLGMKIGERDVFLDNVQEKAAMVDSLEAGLVRAENRGAAVMIGHTWSPELAPALAELYPSLIERGYVFSTASRLIAGKREQ
ncbi:MAG: divergent polysaccharide deacetylase family protein [Treponema sp.]|jgi:polysaccharide deacetylase 2 family uncharacterized protein YibQ|nr:divergent polysaccharide deacetylase family protein [Treponema sp.]